MAAKDVGGYKEFKEFKEFKENLPKFSKFSKFPKFPNLSKKPTSLCRLRLGSL